MNNLNLELLLNCCKFEFLKFYNIFPPQLINDYIEVNVFFVLVRRPMKLLKPIALHEIGHSLGFGHVPSFNSIMFRYSKNDPNPELSHEDIARLQAVYGKSAEHISSLLDLFREIPFRFDLFSDKKLFSKLWNDGIRDSKFVFFSQLSCKNSLFFTGTPNSGNEEPDTLMLCDLMPDPEAIVMLGDGYIYAFTGRTILNQFLSFVQWIIRYFVNANLK